MATTMQTKNKLDTVVPMGVIVRDQEAIKLAGDLARRELFSTVKFIVNQSKIKRQDIADALGVDKAVVSRMLAQPRNLTVSNAGRLLGAMGVWLHFDPKPAGLTVAGHCTHHRVVTKEDIVTVDAGLNQFVITIRFEPPSASSTPKMLNVTPSNPSALNHAIGIQVE